MDCCQIGLVIGDHPWFFALVLLWLFPRFVVVVVVVVFCCPHAPMLDGSLDLWHLGFIVLVGALLGFGLIVVLFCVFRVRSILAHLCDLFVASLASFSRHVGFC